MIKQAWKTVKDWGLLGNMAWAAIVAGIPATLPFAVNFLPFLKTPITLIVPVYLLIVSAAIFFISIILIVKAYSNHSRIHGELFGYYRRSYEILCFPYNRYQNGVFAAKIVRSMEFVITRNEITTIGPYFYYSYEPRSANGIDEIIQPSAKILINGKTSCVNCDLHISKSGNGDTDRDKLKVNIHTVVPFKSGDIVRLELQYEILGQHASCREELNKYFIQPTLKDNYRNKAQKKAASEMFYCFARHSSNLTIRVIFPDKFPWRHIDNFEDIFMLSIGTRPIGKKATRKIVKVISNSASIEMKSPRGIGMEHGFYIFWMVPTKKELIAAGFPSDNDESSNQIVTT
uniref:hypothetical protein n=1 Tax=Candidatus Electronema sp. TaxID=2698783 RepID=UPI004056E737